MPSIDDDDELAALRRRAYAPGADISSDPAALQRLLELEEREATDDRALSTPVPEAGVVDAPEADASDPDTRTRPRRRPRRSTVILLSAAALVIVLAITAVTVVQRVQTHPLQAEAPQIARLTPDAGYEAPDVLTVGSGGDTTAYTEFEGFRAIVSAPPTPDRGEYCLTVFQPELLSVQDAGGWAYDGQFVAPACTAGIFPAAATLRLLPGSPELDHTSLPEGTALQFVFDREDNEVVVFRG